MPSRKNKEQTSVSSRTNRVQTSPPLRMNIEQTSQDSRTNREKTPPPSCVDREQTPPPSHLSRAEPTPMHSRTNRVDQTSTIPLNNSIACDISEKCTEGNVSLELDLLTARSSPRPSLSQMTNRDTSSALSTGRKKRPLSSKDIIHTLFDLWQPQLSASYRPNVRYVPTDFSQFRAFSEMSHSSVFSLNCENHKFRAAERVVETCNMLNGNALSNRTTHSSSRRQSYVKT